MPRPAIPKPGFSLLRLHNTRNPHRLTTLDSRGKTNLINSIAQDIEGCIWAVGQYIKLGVLDATHTTEFDHIINAIHQEERDGLQRKLHKMVRKAMVYKRRERRALRKLEKQRKQGRRQRENKGERETTINQDSADEPATTTNTETIYASPVPPGRADGESGTGPSIGLADADIPSAQSAQPTRPIKQIQPTQRTQETQGIRETQVALPAINSALYPLLSPMDVDAPSGPVVVFFVD